MSDRFLSKSASSRLFDLSHLLTRAEQIKENCHAMIKPVLVTGSGEEKMKSALCATAVRTELGFDGL